MNVLITGGLGFIGSNYCVNSIEIFDTIVILDRNSYCSNINNISEIINNDKVVVIEKDIMQINLLELLIKYKITHIIHFAAQTHVDNSYDMILEFVNDNIISTCNILEACKQYGKLDKILIMSTDEIYGPSVSIPLYETSNFNPTNPYSASKASAEMFINAYKYSYKLPIIIIRCNNVYGPKQYPEKVIPKFIRQILNNEAITIHGNGNKIRDFIYVDDVCKAVTCVLKNGIIGEIYNIGIENPFTITKLALFLTDKMKSECSLSNVDDRAFNDDRYYVNCDKLKELGWDVSISWDEGIDRTISWIRNNLLYWKLHKPSKDVLNIKTFTDSRGELKFIDMFKIKEQFISTNKKNVIRGIHRSPYGKIIVCLKGSVIDYVINLETGAFTKYILTENSRIYVPPNYGHLFLSLEDNTEILYQLEGNYDEHKEINIHYRDPYINLDIPWERDYIVSEKDNNNSFTKEVDYIILGGNGFLGSYTCGILKKMNKNFIKLDTRLEDLNILIEQLKILKPKYVICAAGISGKPTVQWCENNKDETLYVNYTLQLRLVEICKKLNIHLTLYGSGLIYKNHGLYDELSEPNMSDLYYSKIRILLEKDLDYGNVLYLRILYPISGDGNKKCFLTKIKSRLDTLHDIRINCTVLPDLIPHMFELIETNKTGIYNFTNPGLISIPEIVKLFDENAIFKIVKTYNNSPELDNSKLKCECPKINNINDALTNLKTKKIDV